MGLFQSKPKPKQIVEASSDASWAACQLLQPIHEISRLNKCPPNRIGAIGLGVLKLDYSKNTRTAIDHHTGTAGERKDLNSTPMQQIFNDHLKFVRQCLKDAGPGYTEHNWMEGYGAAGLGAVYVASVPSIQAWFASHSGAYFEYTERLKLLVEEFPGHYMAINQAPRDPHGAVGRGCLFISSVGSDSTTTWALPVLKSDIVQRNHYQFSI